MLAIWGNDEDGRPYVHIRIYKQSRIYGDVVIYGGEVKVACRDCFRWHTIRFTGIRAELIETPTPAELDNGPEVNDPVMDER